MIRAPEWPEGWPSQCQPSSSVDARQEIHVAAAPVGHGYRLPFQDGLDLAPARLQRKSDIPAPSSAHVKALKMTPRILVGNDGDPSDDHEAREKSG